MGPIGTRARSPAPEGEIDLLEARLWRIGVESVFAALHHHELVS